MKSKIASKFETEYRRHFKQKCQKYKRFQYLAYQYVIPEGMLTEEIIIHKYSIISVCKHHKRTLWLKILKEMSSLKFLKQGGEIWAKNSNFCCDGQTRGTMKHMPFSCDITFLFYCFSCEIEF